MQRPVTTKTGFYFRNEKQALPSPARQGATGRAAQDRQHAGARAPIPAGRARRLPEEAPWRRVRPASPAFRDDRVLDLDTSIQHRLRDAADGEPCVDIELFDPAIGFV